MRRRVRLTGLDHNLLQSFRLLHAVAEAGVRLDVDRDHTDRWKWLAQWFDGLDAKPAWLAPHEVDTASIDHATPVTALGPVQRPLVFAHGIAERCREHWTDDRDVRISFAGKMTEPRQQALAPLTEQFGDDFRLVATNAGRHWPTKAWDDEYYQWLGRSQLVACPDGDYVWTYRFFEAALCGAIPVIQNHCEHYDGFRFHTMADDPATLRWDAEWAEHNAQLARERLTVPHDELRAAVGA